MSRDKWTWDPTHPFAPKWYFWLVTFSAAGIVGLVVGVVGIFLSYLLGIAIG